MKIEDFFIDFCASFSKGKVECSSMNEVNKELAKFGIDLGVDYMKKLLKTTEGRLKYYAKFCGIKKITRYIYIVNGVKFPITEIKGGNISLFCNFLGISLLSQQNKEIVEQFIKNNIFKLIDKTEMLIE